MVNAEELLKQILEEQKKVALNTTVLERDRIFAALMDAGLGQFLMFANEFNLAAGATANMIQLVPDGTVYLYVGPSFFHTNLGWWVSYDMYIDSGAPAVPFWTAARMPALLETPDFRGIARVINFVLHTVTNNHVANPARGLISNNFLMISTETWDMLREVYLDSVITDMQDAALRKSGIRRV